MVPGIWIGSRSQFVRSTGAFTVAYPVECIDRCRKGLARCLGSLFHARWRKRIEQRHESRPGFRPRGLRRQMPCAMFTRIAESRRPADQQPRPKRGALKHVENAKQSIAIE